MSTVEEIENAIEQLPMSQVQELVKWLEEHRARLERKAIGDEWLSWACGAIKSDLTTDEIMKTTRGEE